MSAAGNALSCDGANDKFQFWLRTCSQNSCRAFETGNAVLGTGVFKNAPDLYVTSIELSTNGNISGGAGSRPACSFHASNCESSNVAN